MAWLWLISVGVSDVQFPVWKKDSYGQWTGPMRLEVGRAGIRQLHEDLLALLNSDRIELPDSLPKQIGRDEARDLKFECVEIDDNFIAEIKNNNTQIQEGYRISKDANQIDIGKTRLPLFCAKVQPLLSVARDTFNNEPVTVVVLNTRRDERWRDAKNEPVAAGPLIAKFLADRFRLSWVDNGGQLPAVIGPNISTWVDILTGNEMIEDVVAQKEIVQRLTGVIRAWNPGPDATPRIAVTTTGGMPQLKPIIERVPATCLGQERVKLLEQPEYSPPMTSALDYQAKWTERETLRFHCAEALRKGDYVGAYGIASRYELPWTQAVRDRLGPLLELPYHGASLLAGGHALKPHELHACQVEARLCGGDAVGAVVQLHVLLESAVWELIEGNAPLRDLHLEADSDYECLRGPLPPPDGGWPWPGSDFKWLIKTDRDKPERQRIENIVSDGAWASWLAHSTDHHRTGHTCGKYCTAAQNLNRLVRAYNVSERIGAERTVTIRRYRNRLVHGAGRDVDLSKLVSYLQGRGLITGIGKAFGQNFLSVDSVSRFLSSRGTPNLGNMVNQKLDSLLTTVIEA